MRGRYVSLAILLVVALSPGAHATPDNAVCLDPGAATSGEPTRVVMSGSECTRNGCEQCMARLKVTQDRDGFTVVINVRTAAGEVHECLDVRGVPIPLPGHSGTFDRGACEPLVGLD
jgi:hypothetical protein